MGAVWAKKKPSRWLGVLCLALSPGALAPRSQSFLWMTCLPLYIPLGEMWWGKWASPVLGSKAKLTHFKASWLRRMPLREGDFLFC